ncbi:MAG: glutathione S-transferase family protein, partial [Alphaproteobacteria bacterium]|nr:glutathione S-transferase family protein [Alphaproteobacteria bacterium]
IPTYEAGGLALFETGAIVLAIASAHAGLLPGEPDGRARAIAWMFAAVSTVEPPIVERSMAMLVERDKPWYAARMPMLEERVRVRLRQLSAHLRGNEWIDGAFSAGDLLMVHTLLRLAGSGLLEEHANLAAYVARAQARGAYQRAFAAQAAVFAGE